MGRRRESILIRASFIWANPATATQADPASRRQLLLITTGGMHHNSGSLAFDNGKNLFLGIGDGNKGDISRAWAQNLDVFHGKMLRINVDLIQPGRNFGWGGISSRTTTLR